MIGAADYGNAFGRMRQGFVRREKEGLVWLCAPSLVEAGVLHGFTTRWGGVSEVAGLDSLNLGWNRPDDPRENVMENYHRLSEAAGFSYDSMALVAYEHGGNVCVADGDDRGKGFGKGVFSPCDGLVSRDPNLTMVTLHADCLPVFLFEPAVNAGGMLHAGWKGTALRIGERAAGKIAGELGGRPERMLAAVGPCICPDHFEVDQPVVSHFWEAFGDIEVLADLPWQYFNQETGKYHIDLAYMMALQLLRAGLRPENITLAGACTYGNGEDFYSYRRDGRPCGAMAGFLRVNAKV